MLCSICQSKKWGKVGKKREKTQTWETPQPSKIVLSGRWQAIIGNKGERQARCVLFVVEETECSPTAAREGQRGSTLCGWNRAAAYLLRPEQPGPSRPSHPALWLSSSLGMRLHEPAESHLPRLPLLLLLPLQELMSMMLMIVMRDAAAFNQTRHIRHAIFSIKSWKNYSITLNIWKFGNWLPTD